jgi:unsaturated rhamnogalacturonyl hydrolase
VGEAPMSLKVVRSEMNRNPEASYIDGQEGNLKWNYTTGLELKAMLDVYEKNYKQARKDKILDYVDAWYDAIIDSTGTIYKYKRSNYSTDHICPGRTLFQLYDITGKEKYRMAMDTLYRQIQEQPRTPEGGFWHKKIYPNQMWLDGLYMAQPFYAEYTKRYVPDSLKAANYEDIALQFRTVYEHTYDPTTGLLRHAWDSSHEMFWCDKTTGQSAHAWGRAMGWYAMALVDVAEILPEGEPRSEIIDILNKVMDSIMPYSEMSSFMWYQVLDSPGRQGNYLEATCSAMFVYTMLKGTRLGILQNFTADKARRHYVKMLQCFVRLREGDIIDLTQCCEVAGLGGKQNRSGDYDYYINEPVRSNDPKGIGPLIWAALEIERQ